MSRLRLGALIFAMAAMLVPASAAMAKGGGGGGGGTTTCARITNFTVGIGFFADGRDAVTATYSVDNQCFDEHSGSANLTIRNNATGAQVVLGNMLSRVNSFNGYEYNTWTQLWGAAPNTSYTFTLDVYAPNGKLSDHQTRDLTTPSVLAPAT